MLNQNEFANDEKFLSLSPFVRVQILQLDQKLTSLGYIYKGVWRDDKETGGFVSVFEVVHKRGRRKNLITLRPQQRELKVEIYWGEKDKHYFDFVLKNSENYKDMYDEINRMYIKISN